MAKYTKWWEYCSNCSYRVEVLETDIPSETLLICTNCTKQEIVDITSQNRPE